MINVLTVSAIQRLRRAFPRHEDVLALCDLVERNATLGNATELVTNRILLECAKCNATREKNRERVRKHRRREGEKAKIAPGELQA